MANEEPNNTNISSIHENEPPLYDIFINFARSDDTQFGFTGNLFNALRLKRFKIFTDNEDLKSGDQVVDSIFKALERSRIAIVVFTKYHPFSTLCLDELVKIVECKQEVIPIFYDVDPSDVRHQREIFDEAFAKHQRILGNDAERFQKWKSALYTVANIPGYDSRCSRSEYELIENIVHDVSCKLPRYQVFLSFSEQDTGYSFSAYLYNALNQEGFNTYMKDSRCKEEGDQTSQSVVEVIEKSKLSIIVLSENYAYSSSCLGELVTILDVMKNKNQLVWPIFYKVEPTIIRYQKDSYEKAMNKHEIEYGKDSEKVKAWRSALSEVANLNGQHMKHGYDYEYEFVEKIVEAAIIKF